MAVALFPRERRVDLVAAPSLGALEQGQVRVRTLRVGFCATDREMIHGGLAETPAGSDHIVLGHELVGVVEQVGAGVAGVAGGDLVVAAVRRGCGRCSACAAGRPDFCSTDAFLEHGIRRLHGFARPVTDIDAAALVPVNAEVAEIGFLAEPMSVVMKAIDQVAVLRGRVVGADLAHPANVVVAGAGTVGLLAVMALRAQGHRVTVLDRLPVHSVNASIALAAGARYAQVEGAELSEWQPGTAFDVALECSGSAIAALELLRHLHEGGGLVWVGIPLGTDLEAVAAGELVSRAVLRQLAIVGTVNASTDHLRRAVRCLSDLAGAGLVQKMVTAVQGINDFRRALDPGEGAIKTAIEFMPMPAAKTAGATALNG